MDKVNLNFLRDTFTAEQYREYHEFQHQVVRLAFRKCVRPTSEGGSDPYGLREEERRCVEEYAFLYAGYCRREFLHGKSLYDSLQRDMAIKAQEEQRQMMARMQNRGA
ncbi:hypothetical protein AGDE_04754 [Angomonas deanei]|uniref:Uncharacterized protein n=1 Tax=Angomonas deanei TaxID=59799 RepID=A0A7G2C9M9_9TRYP|nr:hypothetical protein AGDE_04754 [Angomonas deanei]CAD2215704.1 hypothetical protein, conserved [Angomonas deanei]|eukprot:EPY39175.1 hypothetical protein AGDE_04754 [Angomonas deanei]